MDTLLLQLPWSCPQVTLGASRAWFVPVLELACWADAIILAGLQKVAEFLRLRDPPSRLQLLLNYVPDPVRHKARDVGARIDYQLQEYAPWQIALFSALTALLVVQLLRWASAASEDVRERGTPLQSALQCLKTLGVCCALCLAHHYEDRGGTAIADMSAADHFGKCFP